MATEHQPVVKVSAKTWKELNSRKEPGESFEDVLSRMLEEPDTQTDE